MKSHQRPPGKSSSSHKPPPHSSSSSKPPPTHHHQPQQQPTPRPNSSPDPPTAAAAAAAAAATTKKPPSSSSDPKPSPTANPNPHPSPSPSSLFPPPSSSSSLPPPPPPAYGFHMLERRTIVLADGSVRSYFALPPDYPMDPSSDRFFPYGAPVPGLHEPPRHPDHPPYWSSPPPSSLKRKLDEPDELAAARSRLHVAQYGNPNCLPASPLGDERFPKHAKIVGDAYLDGMMRKSEDDGVAFKLDVDPEDLRKAYLKYAKLIHESPTQKRKYLDDGKGGNLSCAVCGGRPSKDFPDVHRLIMHAYTCSDSHVDHLGLHKALCVLMGWNYAKVPDNGKGYQLLSAKDAAASREDLIVWPPHVLMYNTSTGKRKDGRLEGMGNKEMDNWLREAGFGSGKAKSMYGKEGHLGITLVKFADGEAGLREAERLADFLLRNNRGREGWVLAQASQSTHGSEGNPLLVKLDEKGDEKRILYGSVALASDLDIIEFDTRRKLSLRSRSEFSSSGN